MLSLRYCLLLVTSRWMFKVLFQLFPRRCSIRILLNFTRFCWVHPWKRAPLLEGHTVTERWVLTITTESNIMGAFSSPFSLECLDRWSSHRSDLGYYAWARFSACPSWHGVGIGVVVPGVAYNSNVISPPSFSSHCASWPSVAGLCIKNGLAKVTGIG